MRKRSAMILAAVLVTGTIAASGVTGMAESDESFYITASHGYGAVQHWEIKTIGMQDAAEEMGVKFDYKYADGDLQQEVADIENMVEMGADYIIVGPCNSEGIVPTIQEVQDKGVMVGTCDIGINGVDVASFVTSDNYGIGQIAAEYIADQMGGKGEIAVLTWPAASATADRADGFFDKLKDYPDIVVKAEQDCNADRNTSMQAAESILQENPDIQFVWGANAEMALGAYAATQSMNRTDVKVVAVDTDGEVMEAIESGSNLCATVSQDPYTMGYEAMMNAVKALNGEEVEDLYIECELVTADNCADIMARDEAYLNK